MSKVKNAPCEFKFLTYDEVKNLKNVKSNRNVRREYINQMKTDMVDDMPFFQPIQITTHNVCTDGQHRSISFMELIEAGLLPADSVLPAQVIKCKPGEEINIIRKINSRHHNWGLDDYVKSNIAQGDPSCIKLVKWCEEHFLCINERKKDGNNIKYAFGVAFMTGKAQREALRDNKLILTDADLELGNEIYNEIDTIRQILNWENRNIRYDLFAQVWHEMRDRHTWREWKAEFKARSKAYPQDKAPYVTNGFRTMIAFISNEIDRKKANKLKKAM